MASPAVSGRSPPVQITGRAARTASMVSRSAAGRRAAGAITYRAGPTGPSGLPSASTGRSPTTSARCAWRSRKSRRAVGFQLSTRRVALRVSASSVSSAPPPAPAKLSGQARTTVRMVSSFRTLLDASAARSSGAPARTSTGLSFKRAAALPRLVTAWTRRPAGARAGHSAAMVWSRQTTSAGIAGGTSSQTASACSTAGGITSTTGRPRSSAARAALTSVTRTSVVKGRGSGSDASFGAIEMQLRALLLLGFAAGPLLSQTPRPRARDLGIVVGVLPPGPLDAITDVTGVRVGHATIARGDSINTGVTAILPPGANVFREKVPAAVVVGNAFGKLMGSTQVNELGELESPIVLTCTLCVPRAADAVLTFLLDLPGNADVRSANPLVAETNDGFLSDIRVRPVGESDVLAAIRTATGGPVAEGAVGAGRGTVAFGWKGGIGPASRTLPVPLGGWTVGALVQSNFGGVLTINGAPVGREDGSIIIVVATDAPLDHRQLERLGRRALAGLARTGSSFSNGSGDYVIAFSTVRPRPSPSAPVDTVVVVRNDAMSPLFEAVIEATEEAIYNSLLRAETVRGYRGTVPALPLDSTRAVLRRFGAVRP